MIEAQKIEGRRALVQYLKGDLSPAASETEAELIHIVFPDTGERHWLIGPAAETTEE